PFSNAKVVGWANDLNPLRVKLFRCTRPPPSVLAARVALRYRPPLPSRFTNAAAVRLARQVSRARVAYRYSVWRDVRMRSADAVRRMRRGRMRRGGCGVRLGG